MHTRAGRSGSALKVGRCRRDCTSGADAEDCAARRRAGQALLRPKLARTIRKGLCAALRGVGPGGLGMALVSGACSPGLTVDGPRRARTSERADFHSPVRGQAQGQEQGRGRGKGQRPVTPKPAGRRRTGTGTGSGTHIHLTSAGRLTEPPFPANHAAKVNLYFCFRGLS